jgi:Metallo-peptidase family M12
MPILNARSLLLVGLCLAWTASPAAAQIPDGHVGVILSNLPQSDAEKTRRIQKKLDEHAAQSIRKLPLTKSEVWAIPESKLEAAKQFLAKQGVAAAGVVGGKDGHELFRAAQDMKLNDKQRAMVELAKRSQATMGVKLVAGPTPAEIEYAMTVGDASTSDAAAKLKVMLSDQTTLTIDRTGVEVRPDRCVWRGKVETTGAMVTLMLWPNGRLTGSVQNKGRIHSISHLGGRVYSVVEMSEERMPNEHAPMPNYMRAKDPNLRDDALVKEGDGGALKHLRNTIASLDPKLRAKAADPASKPALGKTDPSSPGTTAPARPSLALSQDVVIDVIVAYTKKAASHYMDVKRELVEMSVEEGNNAFRNSKIDNVKLRLVYAYQTNYVEKGTHFDHVWRFADKGDGYMDEIHKLRDKYRGDVAVLIVDDPNGCGLSTRVHADANEAFAVVHHECSVHTYSMAHEIGHLIGARHDRGMDTNTVPFPYGHGFVNGTAWRDIMSYKESCGGCPRLPVWSSPKLVVDGTVAGSEDTDNARVIIEQAARVAAFR